MADILRITTPVINKNQAQPNKQVVDPSVPFNPQDISKVIKPSPQGELLKQNNGMIQKEEASTILMNLLKDPSVTVNFLKNIFMLQEIIKLLSVNNQTMTQEIEQLFNALLIGPEDIVAEMVRQENTSTAFKGDLFNFLRTLATDDAPAELRNSVANLLKSINSVLSQRNILDALSNSLKYLSESLEASKSLSSKLYNLSLQLRGDDARGRFHALKGDVSALLKEVEGSILFSDKMAKVIAITNYNLSRFNDNPDFFQESVSNLLMLLNGKQEKAAFLSMVREFASNVLANERQGSQESSQIMDVLAKIIGRQSDDPAINLLNAEKIEKIIHSLLSSPCNFTPLLHFVIPVQYMDIKSFAEIWVNPNDEGREQDKDQGRSIHMLIVFDIEGIGQFEAELYVNGQDIDFSLFCPAPYVKAFSGMADKLSKSISATSYRFRDIKVDKLERQRSLMDVFKSLPHKRTGVDVKA